MSGWYIGLDRVKQVDAIADAARDIVDNGPTLNDYNGDLERLVTDLTVDFTESVDLPDWWGERDTAILGRKIRKSLSSGQ